MEKHSYVEIRLNLFIYIFVDPTRLWEIMFIYDFFLAPTIVINTYLALNWILNWILTIDY